MARFDWLTIKRPLMITGRHYVVNVILWATLIRFLSESIHFNIRNNCHQYFWRKIELLFKQPCKCLCCGSYMIVELWLYAYIESIHVDSIGGTKGHDSLIDENGLYVVPNVNTYFHPSNMRSHYYSYDRALRENYYPLKCPKAVSVSFLCYIIIHWLHCNWVEYHHMITCCA